MRFPGWIMLLAMTCAARSAELRFDFGATGQGKVPAEFRSLLAGEGKPGEWKVIMDEVAPLMERLSPQAPSVSRRPVLAQVSTDPTDERFPLLVYEKEPFEDFKLTTEFKTVSGTAEQMAGVVFRLQDEKNFYVVRASSLGNTFRFYKVKNGQRGPPVGPDLPVPAGKWHTLEVECKGVKIRCSLDDKELISIEDKVSPYTVGKIGFWTKSDSVSHFAATRIVYTPHELPAQRFVREVATRNSRLLGLKLYVRSADGQTARLIASKNPITPGETGGTAELDVLNQGSTYYGKGKGSATVCLPLRDRNGDVIAAVSVVLKSFLGQTEQNAVVRAQPIVKELQQRVLNLSDLLD